MRKKARDREWSKKEKGITLDEITIQACCTLFIRFFIVIVVTHRNTGGPELKSGDESSRQYFMFPFFGVVKIHTNAKAFK